MQYKLEQIHKDEAHACINIFDYDGRFENKALILALYQ